MSALKCNLLFLISLLSVSFVLNAVIKKQDTGLYSPEDNVEILTFENYNQSVFGSNKPWIVEFYSSWCGFCQRFAPHWKEFAAEAKNWKDIVVIGVLDCANELNHPVCFDMLVTSYPTLRYFHQNYEHLPGNIGKNVPLGDNPVLHKRHLLDALIEDQAKGTSRIDPNLQPFNKRNISDIFESTSDTSHAILIVQEVNDTIGPELAIDFHQIKDVVIRYSFSNNTKLIDFLGSNQLPSMYTIDRAFNVLHLNSFTLNQEGFGKTILHYLNSKNVQVPENIDNEFKVKITDEEKVNVNGSNLDILIEQVKQIGDVVFQADMETVLRYSLRNEVGLTKEITGEKLQALRNYVALLVKYFAFGENGKILLQKIKTYVDSNDPVNGAEISKMMKEAEKPDSKIFSSPRQWLSCKGSLPNSRGYPCGVWKLFHYLTVNAALDKSGDNPKIVLETMHGYIKNFFSCEDCKIHFLQMAERRELSKVGDWNESILWLWAAHNEVNNRLAGDSTEDPAYPKIQFPSKERCNECYRPDNSWNEIQVLEYLKKVYGKENIQYLGSNKNIINLKSNRTSGASRSIFMTSMY